MFPERLPKVEQLLLLEIEQRPRTESRRVDPCEDLREVLAVRRDPRCDVPDEIDRAARVAVLDGDDKAVKVGKTVGLFEELDQTVLLGDERALPRLEPKVADRVGDGQDGEEQRNKRDDRRV